MGSTWVKNHRNIENWKYYKMEGYAHLWQHLIRQANHSDKSLYDNYGNEIKKGAFSTGRNRLSRETGLNASKIERILKKLEIEQQIEQVKFSNCRIISITKWHKYQVGEQASEHQVNINRTTSEQQVNTEQELKNLRIKELKNNKYFFSEKEDFKIKTILDFWNKQNIITHKENESTVKKIHKALKKCSDYKTEDILKAVDNYSEVLNLKGFFDYKWPLDTFLSREGGKAFFPDRFVVENYLSKNQKNDVIRMENPYE